MSDAIKKYSMWVVLLAAAGTFALTMGTRQTMGLFLADVNKSTGRSRTTSSILSLMSSGGPT